MTERQFRELLLSMDDKVRIRKMGTSGDVWVAMGQLVNGATERDLSSYLEAMALSATVTGDNGTDTPIVTRWNGRDVVAGKGIVAESDVINA